MLFIFINISHTDNCFTLFIKLSQYQMAIYSKQNENG